ncbi:hypothetical protein M3Y98_00997300 [Aphelenchoides besseyi]|nr:hypothetical protein M3Y98_00997300 [Aphelenchoides besseyi]KAI6195120.1 hypothetical protein M3Y96_01197100 [Aphelenchoides besseyi]
MILLQRRRIPIETTSVEGLGISTKRQEFEGGDQRIELMDKFPVIVDKNIQMSDGRNAVFELKFKGDERTIFKIYKRHSNSKAENVVVDYKYSKLETNLYLLEVRLRKISDALYGVYSIVLDQPAEHKLPPKRFVVDFILEGSTMVQQTS